jgi:Predicted transcriptional regulators
MGYAETIGQKVADLRKTQGLSAQKLADYSGLSRSVITNLENGRKGEVTVTELMSLGKGLGISPLLLLIDPDSPYEKVGWDPIRDFRNVDLYRWFALLPPLGSPRGYTDPNRGARFTLDKPGLLEDLKSRVKQIPGKYARRMSVARSESGIEDIEAEAREDFDFLEEIAKQTIEDLEAFGNDVPISVRDFPSWNSISEELYDLGAMMSKKDGEA